MSYRRLSNEAEVRFRDESWSSLGADGTCSTSAPHALPAPVPPSGSRAQHLVLESLDNEKQESELVLVPVCYCQSWSLHTSQVKLDI